MNKSILLFALLFLSISLSAQNFEFGLNGGTVFNNVIKAPFSPLASPNPSGIKFPPFYSFKATCLRKNWQYLFSVDYSQLIYISKLTFPDPPPFPVDDYYMFPAIAWKKASYFPIRLGINREVHLGRFVTYLGCSAGYIFVPQIQGYNFDEKEFLSPSAVTTISSDRNPFAKNSFFGLSAGAQIGATYFITKHFGVNTEFQADYLRFNQGSIISTHSYSFPITLGLRYKL